ncbi:MAG: hypothetical protein K0R82_2120 [Flavipsychrobacter sp.]|nr:hypothetical protein [Flavipsychrobacter sp.]
MRQPYWKPQHEVFIRSMLQQEDPTKAYHTAYPKANAASARVGGHRLYNYPHIRQRIEPILKERRAVAHKRALEEGAARERRQNERRLEMRRVLYKVMMRKLRKKRNFIVNGQTVTVEEDPAAGTILNAVVLDLRLEAGYDNWPLIERRFARIMASLLPREKTVHSVINSPANIMQAIISADHSETTLLQNKQVRKNSPLEGGRQGAALTGGCSVTRADDTHVAQTFPPPDAGVANWQASAPSKGELMSFKSDNIL